MKPQDLMVGDLISMGGVIRVVTGIHDKETENGVDLITTMIPGYTFPDSNLSFRASYCYPIPLTPEILEKNGFERGSDNLFSYGRGMYVMMWSKGHYSVGQIFGNWSAFVEFAEIRFIHELQHALRLCGIDKEIVL